jgi:hypothetical protein
METMTAEQYRQLIAKPAPRKSTKPRLKDAKAETMSEDELQKKVADYIIKHHPDVMFDGNSKNVKLEVWQGVAMKAMGKRKGYPDMFIARARRGYHGLYLELKRDGERLKKMDGKWANEHLETQAEVHKCLRNEGYWADFVVGYEAAETIVKWYLG